MRNLIVFILFFIFWGISNAQTESVVVVYTHNTNGILENCNCPERSYGALEKRAAVIDSIRNAEQNVLLLDTGDILDIQKNRLLHKYVVKAYDYMKYDFWTPGDQDFVEGTDFFLNSLSKISAQLVTSNIRYKENLIGQTFGIKKYGNIRIGITGTIRDNLHRFVDAPADKNFKFENQLDSLRPVLEELTKQTEFIILLSHSGFERDQQIAEMFPSVNLIIGGHSQTILTEPEKIGSTYITQVGESGYRLGTFKFIFKDKKIQLKEHKIVLLQKSMSDDSTVVELIKNYHQERLRD